MTILGFDEEGRPTMNGKPIEPGSNSTQQGPVFRLFVVSPDRCPQCGAVLVGNKPKRYCSAWLDCDYQEKQQT